MAWLEKVPADVDLGLVRARGSNGDVWIGITARPRADIGNVPRLAKEGDVLELAVFEGGRNIVANANGTLIDDLRVGLNLPGEWLIRMDDAQGTVALFPIYVTLPPPTAPLLGTPWELPTTDEALA